MSKPTTDITLPISQDFAARPRHHFTIVGLYADSGQPFCEHVMGEDAADALGTFAAAFDVKDLPQIHTVAIFLGALYAEYLLSVEVPREVPATTVCTGPAGTGPDPVAQLVAGDIDSDGGSESPAEPFTLAAE